MRYTVWMTSRIRTFLIAFMMLVYSATSANAISLLRDTEIEDTLHHYADPIFRAAGQPDGTIKIHLVGDNDINAFVTGGRQVFLNTGLILKAETPNELKGVLAHEVGHIAGGHIARSNEAVKAAMRPLILTMGLGVLAAAAGRPDAAIGLLGSAQYFGTLSYLRYSRNQESAADQAAMRYLETTQQSGQGLLAFFERFRFQEVMSEAKRYPYFRTHPLSSDRIGALRSRIDRAEAAARTDTFDDMKRLKVMKAKIDGFMNPPGHTYVKYPETDTSMPARYARAIAYYQDAQTQKALRAIDALLMEYPDNPYFWELKGQVLFEAGRTEEAIAPHQKSVDLMPDAPLLRINLAQAQIAQSDSNLLAKAEQNLRHALARETDNTFTWYQLSVLYDKQGKAGEARLAAAEARFHAGDLDAARSFAMRAREHLARNTPEWRRTADIVLASNPSEKDRQALNR